MSLAEKLAARVGVVEAIRAMVGHLLRGVLLDDAMAEAEKLAATGGTGKVYIVIDVKDGRSAWGIARAIESQRHIAGPDQRRIDISPEARTE